jgi:ribosome-associated toxin RatA of RatAB toxin-antitoxin module
MRFYTHRQIDISISVNKATQKSTFTHTNARNIKQMSVHMMYSAGQFKEHWGISKYTKTQSNALCAFTEDYEYAQN